MIVPQFWAEARSQRKANGKQITVRRFGWSNASEAEAQTHAEARVQEALQRLLSGEKLERRERKVPYNGADGVPIREEIVERHAASTHGAEEIIITRNSYGARCLNTPNVFFADIDFVVATGCGFVFTALGLLLATAFGFAVTARPDPFWVMVLIALAVILSPLLGIFLATAWTKAKGGANAAANAAIKAFALKNPTWNLRVYETPAGYRVLATHQTFAPQSAEVAAAFKALGADPLYAQMCNKQNCFRARVTAKPWRIDMHDTLRPRPGVWPVKPQYLLGREAWVRDYEAKARAFAACKFVEEMGSGVVHDDVAATLKLHDALCGAASGMRIA